jgi:hypothetical protein
MRRHAADWSSLIAGIVFASVGAIALAAGQDRFADGLVWIWSGVLLGLGAALLLRSADRGLGGQDGAGDEVGAEGSEDREVQQAGRSHDG